MPTSGLCRSGDPREPPGDACQLGGVGIITTRQIITFSKSMGGEGDGCSVLGSRVRTVGAVRPRPAGRAGTAWVHPVVGSWARAIGRTPESLDDPAWLVGVGIETRNG